MFREIGTYSKSYRLDILFISIVGILRIAAMLGFIWASKQLIDIATNVIEGNFQESVVWMIATIVSEIFFRKWGQSREQILSTRIQNGLRTKLFNHLIRTVWQGKEKHHSGDTMNRLERDVQNTAEFIASELPSLVITLVQFFASFLFLFNLDRRIALLMVGIVPFFLILSRMYYKRMKRLTHEVRQSESNVHSYLQESIQNKLVLKTHRALTVITEQLIGLQQTLLHQTEHHTRISQLSKTFSSLGFSLGYITVFVYGAYQLQSGIITYGVMTAFLQLVGQIQRPIMQLTGLVSRYISASTAFDRLKDLEQIPQEEQGEERLFSAPCGVNIRNLTFAYNTNSRKIFDKFSYKFSPGSRTAIFGETGAGKTTLLRLLLSLVPQQNGSIEVYTDLESQIVSPLTRRNFIYVPQGNSLISGSIRSNLLLGDPDADDQQIHHVLHTACAEFVHTLSQGIDTICGEKGGTLSEGQAQRIAIARALLGKGNIILFDESTSALDSSTEQELMKRLNETYPHKTLIFITHRHAIIDHCDQTLTIERSTLS